MSDDVRAYIDDNTGHEIGWAKGATDAEAADLLAKTVGDPDGRSGWNWVRLSDGTLMLACFPHGDAYMEISDRILLP